MQAQRLREQGIEPQDATMHLVFEGNAGTGKSSMARDIGKLYYELGLVEKDPTQEGGFLELSRKDLVANYVGQTAQKTAAAIAPGLGGVIFVDEAYQLAGNGSENDYGPEALTELMVQAENNRDNTVFILAGYDGTLESLNEANQGVESRFPTVLHFEDYDEDERMDILGQMMSGYSIGTGDDAEETLLLLEEFAGPVSQGNARDVREAWNKVKRHQEMRINRAYPSEVYDKLPPSERNAVLTTILPEDVRAAMKDKGRGKRVVKVKDVA